MKARYIYDNIYKELYVEFEEKSKNGFHGAQAPTNELADLKKMMLDLKQTIEPISKALKYKEVKVSKKENDKSLIESFNARRLLKNRS